jgi:nitrite reductase/ring-hydroxylating ferredoxin subunit
MPLPWTPVALSRDVPPLGVMPVTVAGHELALWRSASGRLAAWADRCPHRGMRLSHGYVRGEALSCIYHGWSYGAAGNCLRIPAHPGLEPPEAIRVPVHVACEAGGVIWVAETPPAVPPPDLGRLTPLRSLTVEAAVPDLPGLVPQPDGTLRGTVDGVALAIAVQPVSPARCVLHVLAEAAPPARLVALSRWLESLRRQAEEAA